MGARGVQTLSSNDIKALIEANNEIIIYKNQVLKVNAWLEHHPGGALVLKHCVGKDATDEINAYVVKL